MATCRFGLFEFDAASGELRREGRPVRLQPQPARMLALLVARPGELVTREELKQAFWGAETFVDFDRALNFCAGQVRSALGDSATAPRYIETVPKRGYRLIAPVERLADTPAASNFAPTVQVLPVEGPLPRHHLRKSLAWAALALLGVSVWTVTQRLSRDSEGGPPTVLVVPFDNETGATELDRLAKGLSDVTVARLASPDRLSDVRVIGNAAEVRFTFARRDLKAMGERLSARYILLGQLKQDERRLRVVAHLIRVSDQTHLWANTFDRDAPVSLDEQSAIAEAIAQSVVTSLRPSF